MFTNSGYFSLLGWITFPSARKTAFNISYRADVLAITLSAFVCLKKVYCLIFERYFPWIWNSRWTTCFLSALQRHNSLVSWLVLCETSPVFISLFSLYVLFFCPITSKMICSRESPFSCFNLMSLGVVSSFFKFYLGFLELIVSSNS